VPTLISHCHNKREKDSYLKKYSRRAFQNNPGLSSTVIGMAIGRSRRTVDSYIADLKTATEMELDLKIFRMKLLGIPQERTAKRLEAPQRTVSYHLAKLVTLPGTLQHHHCGIVNDLNN
jgi:hypothetical protein